MSVHSQDFAESIYNGLRGQKRAQISAQRSRNPFRLTDAGMLWLIWVPVAILVVGIALIISELEYLRLAAIFLPS